jgi:hypothetical protein
MADDDDQPAKSKRPGCLTYLALIGGVALGGGVYLMGHWDALGGPSKSSAVVLVVIGTLTLLPPLLVLGLGIVMRVMLGKIGKEFADAAKQMVDANKSMYGGVHEFRPAEADDFDGLDRGYYDTTTSKLAELGFRRLGDLVDETIEESTGNVTPIRVLASTDGTTQVGLYHFKLPQMPVKFEGQEMRICDVSSEFSDGTFLLTSNTQSSDLMTPPPRIVKRQHPLQTPPLQLIEAHESEKQKLLAAKSAAGVTCVVVGTLDDAIESEKRQQQAKNEHRKEIGYVDPAEVRRIAEGVSDDADFNARATDAADEARKREQGS